MKILLVHNFFNQSKNIGGEDMVFQTEKEALTEKLGVEHVCSLSVSNETASFFKVFINIFFSFYFFFKVFFIVRRKKIDIVHVHNFFPLMSPAVFLAAKLAGAVTIQTLHNYRWSCIAGVFHRKNVGSCELCKNKLFPTAGIKYRCFRDSRIQSFLAQAAFSFYKVFSFNKAIDYFFALTPFQKEKLETAALFKNAKIILKPNFVIDPIERKEVRKEFMHDFIYVGRFDENKGFNILLDAFKSIQTDYRLTFIGTGDFLHLLEKEHCPPQVEYLGMLSNELVRQHISSSRFLIQPSTAYETFGLTILEAFSSKVPVIGLDIGTRKDFIKNAENGFLCTDGQHLGDILKLAEELPVNEYDRLSENALISFNKFNREKVLNYQVSIYKNILNNEDICDNDFFQ